MDASLFYMRVCLVEIIVGFKQINLVVMWRKSNIRLTYTQIVKKKIV